MSQNWLVAVDESVYSYYAFHFALDSLYKKSDNLFLVFVSAEPTTYTSLVRDAKSVTKNQNAVAKRVLAYYHRKAIARDIRSFMLLAHGRHIGDVLCSTIETFQIDHAILGRRSMGDVKRLLVGSTSRYVVENATCNVAVVKQPLDGRQITQSFLDPKLNHYSLDIERRVVVTNETKEIRRLLKGKIRPLRSDCHVFYSFHPETKTTRKDVCIITVKSVEEEREKEREKEREEREEREKRDLEYQKGREVKDTREMRESPEVKRYTVTERYERESPERTRMSDKDIGESKDFKDRERKEKKQKGKIAWRKQKSRGYEDDLTEPRSETRSDLKGDVERGHKIVIE